MILLSETAHEPLMLDMASALELFQGLCLVVQIAALVLPTSLHDFAVSSFDT